MKMIKLTQVGATEIAVWLNPLEIVAVMRWSTDHTVVRTTADWEGKPLTFAVKEMPEEIAAAFAHETS